MLSLLALGGYLVLRTELFFFGMGRWSALSAGALIILLFVDNDPAMFVGLASCYRVWRSTTRRVRALLKTA